jgi:hypothetical protein
MARNYGLVPIPQPAAINPLANLADMAQLVSAGQQQKRQQQEMDWQTQDRKRVDDARTVLAGAIKQYSTVDPKTGEIKTDHRAIANTLSQAGHPEQAESWLKTATANAESLDKFQQMNMATERQKLASVGDLAYHAKSKEDFLSGVGLAAQHKLLSEDEAHKFMDEVEAAGPDGWQKARQPYLQFSPSYQKEQEELKKPVKVGEGEKVNTPERAAQNLPPLMEGAPKPNTAEQDDARYRAIQASIVQKQPVSPADQAWATAYEKQKTLGPEASAAAAGDRQATAIAAQTAQQGRAQTFAEQQAGRKELTDKVEQPFQTAQTSANTLRDVVAAAKAGNKVAGSLQSLEATMAAIRAQGLNRINTAEIGVTANAGNLWDRLVGWVGKAESGQPVPADIQKDMTQFADILEKAAYQKYITGHRSTTKRYKLTDEQPLPAPPAAMIEAIDPNGVIHHAAIGTPLPAGWKLKN